MKHKNNQTIGKLFLVTILLSLLFVAIRTYYSQAMLDQSIYLESQHTDKSLHNNPKGISHSYANFTNQHTIAEGGAFLVIDSDEKFSELGLPGNGTHESPYLIENLTISGSQFSTGIYIRDTTKAFVIRNCLFENLTTAISFYNVRSYDSVSEIHNGLVLNSSFQNNIIDMVIDHSSGINVVNNNIVNTRTKDNMGLQLCDNSHIAISNNTITYLPSADGSIYIYTGRFISIANNTFINSGIKFDIYDLSFDYYPNEEYKFIIEGNTVNGKPIGYFERSDNLRINAGGYGQILVADCNNVTIQNQEITNAVVGIQVHHSNLVRILNNRISNSGYGILATSNDNITVAENEVYNTQRGIILYTSWSMVNVSDNVVVGSKYHAIGVYAINYKTWSPDLLLGIIENNVVNDSLDIGIIIDAEYVQIRSNVVANNTIGMSLGVCESVIVLNWLVSNSWYGIDIRNSCTEDFYSNEIYYNNFINNNYVLKGSQGNDDSSCTRWYNSIIKKGNYWSD